MNLKGKVALITGSATGIGKDIAEVYAHHGANVVIADINQENASKTADEIQEKYLKETLAITMDVTNKAEVNEGVVSIINNFSKVDILVSNAGIQHISSIIDFDYEDWQRVVNIHLMGGFSE